VTGDAAPKATILPFAGRCGIGPASAKHHLALATREQFSSAVAEGVSNAEIARARVSGQRNART